jgi:hypothetical protein
MDAASLLDLPTGSEAACPVCYERGDGSMAVVQARASAYSLVTVVIPEPGRTPHPTFPRSIFLCSYFVATTERFYAEALVRPRPAPVQASLRSRASLPPALNGQGRQRGQNRLSGRHAGGRAAQWRARRALALQADPADRSRPRPWLRRANAGGMGTAPAPPVSTVNHPVGRSGPSRRIGPTPVQSIRG